MLVSIVSHFSNMWFLLCLEILHSHWVSSLVLEQKQKQMVSQHSSLSCMCMCVDQKSDPPWNGISTRNFLTSSPKFTLEWYSFSNRSLKIALLQIYFNITKLFEDIWKMEASFFSKPLIQWECRDNKKCCHLLGICFIKKAMISV